MLPIPLNLLWGFEVALLNRPHRGWLDIFFDVPMSHDTDLNSDDDGEVDHEVFCGTKLFFNF